METRGSLLSAAACRAPEETSPSAVRIVGYSRAFHASYHRSTTESLCYVKVYNKGIHLSAVWVWHLRYTADKSGKSNMIGQRLLSKIGLLFCIFSLSNCFLLDVAVRCKKLRLEYWKACTEGVEHACEQYASAKDGLGGLIFETTEAALVLSGSVDQRREFFRQQGALWKHCAQGNKDACKEARRCDIFGVSIYCSRDPITSDWNKQFGDSGESSDPDDSMEGMCPAVTTPKPSNPCSQKRQDEWEDVRCPVCNAQMVQKKSPSTFKDFHFWQYDCKKHTTHSGSRFPNSKDWEWCSKK